MKCLWIPMLLMTLTSFSTKKAELIATPLVVTRVWTTPYHGGLKQFMHDMAVRESNDNHTIVSSKGYLGRYQFHPRTLEQVGMHLEDSLFLTHEELQDSAMVLLMRQNDRFLHDIIQKYQETVYNGVYITRSGILAGAHLVGPMAVRSFFDSTLAGRYPMEDSNGTTVQDYMIEFAGYKFRLYY